MYAVLSKYKCLDIELSLKRNDCDLSIYHVWIYLLLLRLTSHSIIAWYSKLTFLT